MPRPRLFSVITHQVLRLQFEICTSPLDRMIHQEDRLVFQHPQYFFSAIEADHLFQFPHVPTVQHPFDNDDSPLLPVNRFIVVFPKKTGRQVWLIDAGVFSGVRDIYFYVRSRRHRLKLRRFPNPVNICLPQNVPHLRLPFLMCGKTSFSSVFGISMAGPCLNAKILLGSTTAALNL
jgi:hypothetical protein